MYQLPLFSPPESGLKKILEDLFSRFPLEKIQREIADLKSRRPEIKERIFFSIPGLTELKNLEKKQQIYLALSFLLTLSTLVSYSRPIFPSGSIPSSTVKKEQPRPLVSFFSEAVIEPLENQKKGYEVFGFAPYWTLDKLSGTDFSTLTTLAYFSITVDGGGNFVTNDPGYQAFYGPQATNLFQRAHDSNTRVVLTLTQMRNGQILALMDNPDAQSNLIYQAVNEVQARGIDGINVDLEYTGDPGPVYRDKFSKFVEDLTLAMHQANPNSKVTVSVYASAVKEPKIYNISTLAEKSDGIFMMAYDFAVAGSAEAMPTAPLYGHKEGQYWYDVSTAVDDFLTQMPPEKLILGVPWYGYNYSVTKPSIKAASYRGGGFSQTYATVQNNIQPGNPAIAYLQEGWDTLGQVGWKAYYAVSTRTWRMIFLDDERSMGVKLDFAKSRNLAGVGIWALGNEDGRSELWSVIKDKLGTKLAENTFAERPIYE